MSAAETPKSTKSLVVKKKLRWITRLACTTGTHPQEMVGNWIIL